MIITLSMTNLSFLGNSCYILAKIFLGEIGGYKSGGPYQNAGKWAREMTECVKTKGKVLKKLYFSYTTCPKCAKVYGKNYVVLFAQID